MKIVGIKDIEIKKVDDVIRVTVCMYGDKKVIEDHTFDIKCGFTEFDKFALALLGTLGYDKTQVLESGIIKPHIVEDCMFFYDEEESKKREVSYNNEVEKLVEKIRKDAGIE